LSAFYTRVVHGLLALSEINGLPTCQPVNRVVPVPALRAELAAQTLALHRVVSSTDTIVVFVSCHGRTVLFRTVLVPAHRACAKWRPMLTDPKHATPPQMTCSPLAEQFCRSWHHCIYGVRIRIHRRSRDDEDVGRAVADDPGVYVRRRACRRDSDHLQLG
jgi:hypothetical protein